MKKVSLLTTTTAIAASSSLHAIISFTGTAILNTESGGGTLFPANTLSLILVDTDNNGFSAATNDSLLFGDSLAQGTFLGSSDDFIIATNGTQGNTFFATAPGIASFSLTNGVGTNNNFAILVFDNQEFGDSSIDSLGTYGLFTDSTWIIPADGSVFGFSQTPDAANFQQLSEVTSGTFTVGAVPEPSTYAALAGLTALAFAARRRLSKKS